MLITNSAAPTQRWSTEVWRFLSSHPKYSVPETWWQLQILPLVAISLVRQSSGVGSVWRRYCYCYCFEAASHDVAIFKTQVITFPMIHFKFKQPLFSLLGLGELFSKDTLQSALGNDRNFSSGFGWFWQVRFGKNFAELFVIQFHAHLQYTGIKRTDYAILCNESFSQSQQNSTIHISATPFYVVKLSALRGRISYSCFDFILIVLAKLYMLRLRFFETWHFMFLILSNRAIAAIILSALIN